MKKVISFFILFFFALFMVGNVFADWNAWVDHSIVKIKQNGFDHSNIETKSGLQSLTVQMAKNEFESFQVFISANNEDLLDVNVTVGAPTKGTDTISDIYMYKEWYINADSPSRPEYTTGYYPDPLLPKIDRYYGETRDTFPFNITSGNIQGVWVDLGTTSFTEAGTYTSTITISANGKPDIVLDLTVKVWNFTLPSTSSYGSMIAILDGLLSSAHMGTNYDSTTIDTLMPIYNNMALYHRISTRPMTRLITSYDWDSETKVLSNMDFTIYDGYYADVLDGTAISSGPYAGAKARTAVIPHTGTNAITNNDDNIDNVDKPIASIQYQQAWYNHFGEMNWDVANTLVTMAVQEPNDHTIVTFRGEQITKDEVALIQIPEANQIDTSVYGTGDPFQRVIMAVHNREEFTGLNCLFNPWIGHYAPANWEKTNVDSTYIYPASKYPNDMERQWAYLSCMSNGCTNGVDVDANGQIDLSMDADPMYNRLPSFYFYKQGVTDFWYFQMNGVYLDDPYYDLWPPSVEGSNGDGTLVYPGVAGEFGGKPVGSHTPNIGGIHDIPIESIRLKYIRDFMEDMEYFKLAKEKVGKLEVDAIVDSMFTDNDIDLSYWNLNTNPDDLFLARENIVNLITGVELCEVNWSCSDWSACNVTQQIRLCVDTNGCEESYNETQVCLIENQTIPEINYHQADIDESGIIEFNEVVDFVNQWLSGLRSMSEVLEVISLWKGN